MTSIAQVVLDKMNGVPPKETPKEVREVTPEVIERRAAIQHLLSTGIWTVQYIKVDGTESKMECTLDPKYIPEKILNSNSATARVIAKHLVQVYAVDRSGWRSFYVDRVGSIEPNLTFPGL